MSIKKLFDSTNKNRNYLSDTDQKTQFDEVESGKNVEQISTKQNTFVPQIDFSEPQNFAKYGSAYLYYKGAIEHIYDYYPYDGSDAEINDFYNKLLDVEKHIFNNQYPRTNGYAVISADGWGSLNGSKDAGYGLPATLEYITFFGGPNTSSYTNLTDAFNNPENSKFQSSNIYDENIYTTAGQPSDYGSGTRTSNLRSNFNDGVTIEFWLKKDAFTTSLTEKEVVYDMWNNNASGSADYGRMRVELTGAASGSPFLITALSGTSGIYQQSIGANLTTGSLENFAHYAISFYNDGSNLITKLYVNGELNDTNTTSGTLSELNASGMMGRIGALLTASASPSGPVGASGSGKLSGSIDEFRFWKVRRDSKQIFDNHNRQVRGGSNTDINNTTLGVYYKFNEGITTDTNIDSTVLDYSGRISNGAWTGYGTNSRSTSSAIVLAGAATTEYLDPIIYSTHPDVSSLKTNLETTGSVYDSQNNNAFINLLPSWLNEDEIDSNSNIRKMSHIMGAYLDKLYLQIDSLTKLKGQNYTSGAYTPLPFAQHLPQSLGLYTPDIFIDAKVTEKFLNRTSDSDMESDLTETKNLIYLNLYNNITNIFKAKGTEKSVKNVFRCFNLDDRVIKLKTYANNQLFELKNNLKLTLAPNTSVNGNNSSNLNGVVYQKTDASNPDSFGYISGTYDSNKEEIYGFTTEANIIFPAYQRSITNIDRLFTEVSLFGMHEANTSSADDTTWLSTDNANFQVYAIRDAGWSKNVYFKLTSSVSPNPFPELTSSVFFDVYDNQEWNFSVRLKPSNFPLTNLVTGATGHTYTLEFQGYNTVNDTIQDSFILTSSVSKAVGSDFLKSAKRIYAGARRTNITGAVLQKSDVLTTNVKHWIRYIDNTSIKQHTYDTNNAGVSDSYRKLSSIDSNQSQNDAINLNTLALHWTFNNITGSDSSGNFYYVTDESSGSAEIRNNYGWIGGISGYQYSGYGYGYGASSTDVVVKQNKNTLKFVDPETPTAYSMINILSDSDKLHNLYVDKPEYYHTIEKSMYSAISEEMLSFFAGIVDFNNIIGEPVHRYRARYKTLEKLREIYFRKVNSVSTVEKFLEYYKWLDDSIAQVVSQLLPASDGVVDDAYNIIESHVLERNKYRSLFPTIEFKTTEPETPILGINEKVLNWRLNHAPVSGLQNQNSPWWLERINRTDTSVSSGDSTVDAQREAIRETANINNNQAKPNLVANGTTYQGSVDILRRHSKPYKLDAVQYKSIHGGSNFSDNKNILFTYNSLYPAGPVSRTSGTFVPQNTLVAFIEDIVPLKDSVDVTDPNKKIKRYFKVNQGRDWVDGNEYTNVKSSFSFPFNIISASINSGHNSKVVSETGLNIDITNLHNDSYHPDLDVPMQGPFTNYAVGGHQSRHVAINKGSDAWYNRAEAWKLLLGSGSGIGTLKAAIGMVGADYPWPEANEPTVDPYPMTASHKAVFFRDHVAKRPVNIRNIQHRTGSTILGNYNRNYEIVHSVGGFSNPRGFVKNPPTLPAEVTQTPSASQGRTILSNRRTDESHFEFTPAYNISYMTSAAGKSIIKSRFSAPGGVETLGQGYGDIRSNDYSVYNSINYRNLSVKRPNQNISGTVSEAVGVGTPGIRVSDIHGNDFGLTTHTARHSGRFGRDSVLVADPGASIDESPSMFKTNRNPRHRIVSDANGSPIADVQYDNFSVGHQIPRSDRQYSWITGSLTDAALDIANIRYWGFAPLTGPQAGYYKTGSNYESYFDFVSASSVLGNSGTASIYQPALDLAIYVNDPADEDSDNNLGKSLDSSNNTYLNDTLLDIYEIVPDLNRREDVFNLLMTKRKNTFGYRRIPNTGPVALKILRKHRSNNTFTYNIDNTPYRTTLIPVSVRGLPSTIGVKRGKSNICFKTTNQNEKIYFNDEDVNNRVVSEDSFNKDTTFDIVFEKLDNNKNYKVNWITYSETLFPRVAREMNSTSTRRTGFNNLYWRDTQSDRISLHSGSILQNSYGVNVSQSSWMLDAPSDFITRVSVPSIDAASNNVLRNDNTAGELQNTYQHVLISSVTPNRRTANSTIAALYARKHLLGGGRSVSSPSGMPIPETGSFPPTVFTDTVDIYGGEALWEAGTQAGVVTKSGSTSEFTSYPSEPWWDDYDSYIEDVELVNRGFSIVPEFRISEHISDYEKYGISSFAKTDTFEIVGTNEDSSNAGFYKDYSNTEFMDNFVEISNKTGRTPNEIKLTCNATIRLNPYKGFYPAQRTIDLIEQFSVSYSSSIMAANASGNIISGITDGGGRPIANTLFAPGILYNTIKAGVAVDYPVMLTDEDFESQYYGNSSSSSANVAWMINAVTGGDNYVGGEFWDRRIPFEAIIEPEKYISNITLHDMESHPSASLGSAVSFIPNTSDSVYRKMSANFFGEIGNFFLKEGNYTKLQSDTITDDLKFESGSVYGARIKIYRSTMGERTYDNESGSTGNNAPYNTYGGAYYLSATNQFNNTATYPLPQDPRQATNFQESFTMYSRPTAFGPEIGGRPYGSDATSSNVVSTSPVDSVNGFNWSFTPPYYNGEAWLDIVFEPTAGQTYDLEKILSEVQTKYWRVDAGPSASAAPAASSTSYTNTQLIPTFSGNIGTYGDMIYEGKNVNDNAMQLASSINPFGVEIVFEDNQTLGTTNKIAGKKWVIQPKMETPMLNFNNSGIHPITNADGNLSLPTYASGSVPRGMWHQFGVIEPDPNKGIFVEIGDIPKNWLKFHYDVRDNNSIYNKNDAATNGATAFKDIKPLTDIISFSEKNISKRLGQLKDSLVIKEAIVAVPYVNDTDCADGKDRSFVNKKFFNIDEEVLKDSKNSKSVTKLLQNMSEYILPPQFDFVNNKAIEPMVMYFFEFEYRFDKDDLSYIWQNLAPRNYKKITKETSSTSHVLSNNELLSKDDIMVDNVRWMVFKVKQRSQMEYEELIPSQAGQSTKQINNKEEQGYPTKFNWPYDYVSFVETIKFETSVLYKEGEPEEQEQSLPTITARTT